jgi:hypothetical protein
MPDEFRVAVKCNGCEDVRYILKDEDCDFCGTPLKVKDAERFNDQVNSPQHYADHYPFEVCEAIKGLLDSFCEGMEAYDCYCLGNELKYRLRAGFKEPDKIEQDIKKALWYNKARREG